MKRMSICSWFARNQDGQVLPLVALAIVVLFGATSVAVDIGTMYVKKTNLQTAVDAGALAGAQELASSGPSSSPSSAETTGEQIAQKNVTTANYTASTSGNKLTVTGEESVPTFFARVLGIQYLHVTVSGTAEYGNPSSTTGIMPFGVTATEYTGSQGGSATNPISITGSKETAGNWGYLDLPRNGAPTCSTYTGGPTPNGKSQGASTLDENLACGGVGNFYVGEQLAPKTGVDVSQIAEAIASRPSDLGIVPIISSFPKGNNLGATDLIIKGFAVFHISGYDKSTDGVYGYFTGGVIPGPIGSGSVSYGAYAVSLVN